MMTRRQRVVAAIREGRAIHQEWVDWLHERPPGHDVGRSYGGGIGHHEQWIRTYNDTLRELGEVP